MAASINDGYGSATFLLERFGSAARNSSASFTRAPFVSIAGVEGTRKS
jgi:hypothetical protein